MGLDIHAYIEIWDGKKWIPAMLDPFVYEDQMWEPFYHDLGYKHGDLVHIPDTFDIERNYTFFATLRHGDEQELQGIKYCKIEPIQPENREVPEDISPELRQHISKFIEYIGYSSGLENVYWRLLADFLNEKWDTKMTTTIGPVENKHVHLFGDGNQPFPQEITKADLIDVLKNRNNETYQYVSWQISYSEAIGEEYLKDIIGRLSAYGEPNNVRMIFFFYA